MSLAPPEAANPADHALPADERSRKALQEPMLVKPELGWAAGAEGLTLVYSKNGAEYRVDVIEGRCDCEDAFFENPDAGCKHVRRAAVALGYLPVPAWVDDRDRLDWYLKRDLDALDRD